MPVNDRVEVFARLTVLICALHAEPKGYMGGGWTRTIELLKIATSHNVKFVVIETKPTFKSAYGLNYEAIEIPSFLNKSFIGRAFRPFVGVIQGVRRLRKGDIDLVLSPVELPECVLPAYVISRLSGLPWTSEIHLIPLFASLWKNGKSMQTSSMSSLFREARDRGMSRLFSIFASLTSWLVFRAFRRGVMLAPSKSVVEDMRYVDKDIVVRDFYPGNGIAIDRIESVESKDKRYDAVYVGVLTESKGVFDTIRSWQLVVKKNRNLVLAIVGRGSEDAINKVKKLVSQFNIRKNVRFPYDLRTGAPKSEDVWLCMKQSRMLIHLSVSDTWPQVIGEALACGLPVVTYDLRPQRYSFGRCPVVFRVPVKHLDECASRIMEVMEKSELYGEIAKDFSKGYSWDAVMAAEKQAYIKIIRSTHLRRQYCGGLRRKPPRSSQSQRSLKSQWT